MQIIPRCKNVLIIRNLIKYSSTQFTSFHSTSICNDKWKKNKNSDSEEGEPLSKYKIRFTVHEKHSHSKALKNLLSQYGNQGTTITNDVPWKIPTSKKCNPDTTKKKRPKTESLRAEKIQNHRLRSKYLRKSADEDDNDDPKTIFRPKSRDRWKQWSSDSSGTSRHSIPKFNWKDAFRGTNSKDKSDTANEAFSKDKMCSVGLLKDRRVLGLSPMGPLNIQDVKNAFHLSALKWHPDKHQGPTQAEAEEKFKLCVDAYKSLCSALSET